MRENATGKGGGYKISISGLAGGLDKYFKEVIRKFRRCTHFLFPVERRIFMQGDGKLKISLSEAEANKNNFHEKNRGKERSGVVVVVGFLDSSPLVGERGISFFGQRAVKF